MDNFDIGATGNCGGIYCFENLLDGKKYVGQGQVLKERKSYHFWVLNSEKYNDSEYFQEAWNKDGKENFKFWIVEECETDLLNDREIYWIAKLRSYFTEWGYNKTHGGQCIRGYRHSPEAIQKMIDNSGTRGKHPTLETIQKIKDNHANNSGENHWNFGKHHTPETKQKIRKSRIGKRLSEEIKQKRKDNMINISRENNPMWGKCLSDGSLRQLSEAKGITKEIVLQAKQYLDNNIPLYKIARIMNVSKRTIRKVKFGGYKNIYDIDGIMSKVNYSTIIKKEIVQQIEDMLDNNIKVCKIAKELGISEPTIYKVKNGGYKDIYGI